MPDSNIIFIILLVVLMGGMMWWQSRNAKKQQAKSTDFRQSLKPGIEVATFSGLLGTVVSVDLEKERVVIDSEGSRSVWRIQAITQPPVVPAYVHDNEVDADGNALSAESQDAQSSPAGGAATDGSADEPYVADSEPTPSADKSQSGEHSVSGADGK